MSIDGRLPQSVGRVRLCVVGKHVALAHTKSTDACIALC